MGSEGSKCIRHRALDNVSVQSFKILRKHRNNAAKAEY